MTSDATWQALEQAAERLSSLLPEGETLAVMALRRSTGLLTVTEGLFAGDNWTDVFEPVRRRRYLSRAWIELQTVDEAAQGIGTFLRERPDQPGCEYCRDQSNRDYHLDQIGTRSGSSDLLKRCSRCGTLWECAAFGRDDVVMTAERARRRYPDADLPAQ